MIEIKSERVCFLVDKVTDVIPFSFHLLLILELLILELLIL